MIGGNHERSPHAGPVAGAGTPRHPDLGAAPGTLPAAAAIGASDRAAAGWPALVLLVIDESPSEQGLDPWGFRHLAGRRTLALLRGPLAHQGDRIACVHFASTPGPWLGPTNPHRRFGFRRLRDALQPAGNGSGTDIGAALVLGADLVPDDWLGLVVVVLLSDGQDGSSAGQLARAVGRFPASAVHAISIGSTLPTTWDRVPLGSASVIPSMARPDEVEWAVARVLYDALGLQWAGPIAPFTTAGGGQR